MTQETFVTDPHATPAATDEPLRTIPQAAYRLSVSRATLYRMLDRGDLASIRIGRSRRIEAEEINRFLERCRDQGPAVQAN